MSLLDDVVAFRDLPAGCTRWGIRTVESGYGFAWPDSGWVDAPGPVIEENASARPSQRGDGLCAANTWAGLATVDVPPIDLLLVAYGDDDLLSDADDTHSVRLRRAFVSERVDGLELLFRYGRFADLERANLAGLDLRGVCLIGANLRGARLMRTQLTGASLYGADLTAAQLGNADLSGTDLRHASLRGANLHGTMIDSGTLLYGTDLNSANVQAGVLANARYTID